MIKAFELPKIVKELILARNKLREHYSQSGLKFTLDGNLVGDIGEAVAAELFGIHLVDGNTQGIDGIAPDGRSVQVKATGTDRGPAFRYIAKRADHLLFFSFNFERLRGEVTFNGLEDVALSYLPKSWSNQRSLTRKQIEAANLLVQPHQRLSLLPTADSLQ